jgi:hypothetical protein
MDDELQAVDCTSSTFCVAVGMYRDGDYYQALAETFDGTAWAVVASPNVVGSEANELTGVSCSSDSSCVAVGYYGASDETDHAFAETFNGTTWSLATVPEPSGAADSYLYGVSSTGGGTYMAVGYSYDSTTGQALAETFDGTTWSIATSADAASSLGDELNAVSCTSASACFAVGNYFSTALGTTDTLAETWDGADWTIATSANNASTSEGNVLNAVSCTSATSCVAVGDSYNYNQDDDNQALAETFDGASWATLTAQDGPGSEASVLNGVSCSSATSCVAVGYYQAASAFETLAETFDGSTWTVAASTDPSLTNDALQGVSCTSGTDCIAAGYSATEDVWQTLVENFDGTWSTAVSQSPPGMQGSRLAGTSCTSATFCMAVGSYDSGQGDQTLVEQWDGTSWAIVPTPDTSSADSDDLYGVSCTSATFCVAVGYYNSGNADQTLVEQWDGTSWAIVTSPDTLSSDDDDLSAVSCASPTSCTAVGAYSGSSTSYYAQTLVEQWDGATWTVASSPVISSSDYNYLSGVSCPSSTSCVAVGYYFGSSTSYDSQALVEQWDGTAWTVTTSANPTGYVGDHLAGVSCVSPTSCTAVGSYFGASTDNADQTLVEQWDGTAWTVATSPDTSPTDNDSLVGVSCASGTSCVAVGSYGASEIEVKIGISNAEAKEGGTTLIEAWDGPAWTIAKSADTSPSDSDNLGSVSCISASACMAAGSYNGGGGTVNSTLVETETAPPTGSPGGSPAPAPTTTTTSVPGTAPVTTTTAPKPGPVANLVPTGGGVAATPQGAGYWALTAAGKLSDHGNAGDFGSENHAKLTAPVVAVNSTSNGQGYWLATSNGGVFAFGNARFFGSLLGRSNASVSPAALKVVGIARTADNGGYWLAASNGAVYAFGDAHLYGSMAGRHLNQAIVAIVAAPDGHGYWLAGADGGVFNFGDAHFYGSMGHKDINQHVVGIAATPDGHGYWLVAHDGGVFNFGTARFYGSLGLKGAVPIVGIVANEDSGYRLITPQGSAYNFGKVPQLLG